MNILMIIVMFMFSFAGNADSFSLNPAALSGIWQDQIRTDRFYSIHYNAELNGIVFINLPDLESIQHTLKSSYFGILNNTANEEETTLIDLDKGSAFKIHFSNDLTADLTVVTHQGDCSSTSNLMCSGGIETGVIKKIF